MLNFIAAIKVKFKKTLALLTLQIPLFVHGIYLYGQCDTNLLQDCFAKSYHIQSGVYSIEYYSKFLTSTDTSVLKGKVYFSNTQEVSCNEINKIKFILETSNNIAFINRVDSFYSYNSKFNCFEKYPSSSFDFESLNGTSLWYLFNNTLITNFSCLSVKNAEACYYSSLENNVFSQILKITYTPSEEIPVRKKDIHVVGKENELVYTEKNTLCYLDMFQYDSARIEYNRFPEESIDDSIAFILSNSCIMNPVVANQTSRFDSVINFASFELYSPDDSVFNISNVESRYILLDFWHKGCIPCLNAIPFINSLKETFNETELSILGIDPFDDNAIIKGVINQKHINYCVLKDKNRELTNSISINTYPTVLVIDTKSKRIIYKKSGLGEDDKNEITTFLRNLLNAH